LETQAENLLQINRDAPNKEKEWSESFRIYCI